MVRKTISMNEIKPDTGALEYQRLDFPKNSILLNEGEPGEFAYLIVEGQVDVRIGFRGSYPQTVAKLGKGDVVGEMALFDNKPHAATVVAIEDTKVSAMKKDEFRRMINSMNPIMKGMVGMLVRRLRSTSTEPGPVSAGADWASWKHK